MGFATKFKKKNTEKVEISTPVSETINGFVSAYETDTSVIVSLSGKLDVNSADKTKEEILSVIKDKMLVLDARDVIYISSAGMRLLFEVKKACDAKKLAMEIKNIGPGVYRILQMAGYSAVLNLKVLEE